MPRNTVVIANFAAFAILTIGILIGVALSGLDNKSEYFELATALLTFFLVTVFYSLYASRRFY